MPTAVSAPVGAEVERGQLARAHVRVRDGREGGDEQAEARAGAGGPNGRSGRAVGDHHDERGGQRDRKGEGGEEARERAEAQRAAQHAPRRDAPHVAAGAAEQGEAAAGVGACAPDRREAAGGAAHDEHERDHAGGDQRTRGEARAVQPGDEAARSAPRRSAARRAPSRRPSRRRACRRASGTSSSCAGAAAGSAARHRRGPTARPRRRRPRSRSQDVAAARMLLGRVGGADDRVPAAPTGKLRAEVQHHARDQPQEVDVPEGQARRCTRASYGLRRARLPGAAGTAGVPGRRHGRRPAKRRSTALPAT